MPSSDSTARTASLMALDQLDTWWHAVQLQSLRILHGSAMGYTGPATRKVDVDLFTLALRNLIRAAQMVRSALDAGRAQAAAVALAEFDAAVPRAVDVRDVLEHFDAYLGGTGKLQKAAGSTSPVRIWHETEAQAHILRLGVAPEIVLSVDIEHATAAARDLTTELQALGKQQRDSDTMKRIVDTARSQEADPAGRAPVRDVADTGAATDSPE